LSTVTTSAPAEKMILHTSKPSFFGMLRGELFKISRQWMTWVMLVLLAGVIALPYIITLTVPDVKDAINHTPLLFLTNRMTQNLAVLRVFTGIFLIVITATAIGLEYQLGTIRVLLSRGVGRLQLLAAKLSAIVIVALAVFVTGLLYNVLLMSGLLLIMVGNVNAYNALTPAFWTEAQQYTLTVLISMGATILMATAAAVVGRSLTFGLSIALAWFPIDNIGTIFLVLANRLTHNDFWLNVSAYLFGPNLNIMPTALITSAKTEVFSIGAQPFVKVDGAHTLWVALVYSLIFAAVAIILTWRRDVKE
jgi:ABC-2 type transport system permease protein